MTGTPVRPSTAAILARKARTAIGLVTGFVNRLLNTYWRGASLKRRTILLHGDIFDTDWYIEHNPGLGLTPETAASHFFTTGLENGRQARFFDTRWYYKNSPDLNPLLVDAWTHYRLYGSAEGRTARFFYANAAVHIPPPRSYEDWLSQYEPKHGDADAIAQVVARLDPPADISLVLAVTAGTRPDTIERLLASLRGQSFPRFEVVCGCTPDADPQAVAVIEAAQREDERIRVVAPAPSTPADLVNALAAEAGRPFVAVLPSDGQLHRDALFWLSLELRQHPEMDVVFGDEDRIDRDGRRSAPNFKPDLNYEYLLTHNQLGGLTLFRKTVFQALGGFRAGNTPSAMAYDLALRVTETVPPERVGHVTRILFHTDADAPLDSYPDLVAAHLQRRGRPALVSPAEEVAGHNRVQFQPDEWPSVCIVIPTRDRSDLLRLCIGSLLEKTTYPDYEIIIVDNGSVEAETADYFETLRDVTNLRIIRDPSPFNYSALNNAAVRQTQADYVCLMNNDIEILTWDWLEEMMSFAAQPEVGCVGARLWYPDGRIQHAGVLVGFHGVAGHLHKLQTRQEGSYRHRAALHQSLSAVTAACLVVRKSLYEAVGGLDESLAVAFNDVDLCLKVRNLGYRNVYTPYAEMIHHESATRGVDRTRKQRTRGQKEIATIKARYGDTLSRDPAYNPNLTLTREDATFAFPPRLPTPADILRAADG